MSKKKILAIVFSSLAGVLLIIGIVLAFVLNYDNNAPAAVNILDDGSKIIFKVDMNENYKGYRFNFTSDTKSFYVDSKSNVLNSSEVEALAIGSNYFVSACYLGDNEGANSKFSQPILWQACTYLKQPQITYSTVNQTLTWDSIEYADYYKIIFTGTTSGELRISKADGESLSLLDWKGGKRNFSVIACSNNLCYKSNLNSDIIEVENIYRYRGFDSEAIFNGENLTVKVSSQELYEAINIKIGILTFRLTNFVVTQSVDGTYNYTINLKPIYQSGQSMFIAPANKDNYNIYDGQYLQIK